jgi:hypothetical protein
MTQLEIFILIWIMIGFTSWAVHFKLRWNALFYHLLLGPIVLIDRERK